MSFSSENREKTLRFVLTFHGQATDKLPTGYRHITNSRPTVGRQVAYISGKTCRPSVGRQVFWGALLHNYPLGNHGQATDKLPTGYRHITNSRPTGSLYFRQNLSAVCRPTVGRQSADRRPTDGRQTANCRPTVGRLSAVCRPTGFLGSSSSQLPNIDMFILSFSALFQMFIQVGS